MARLGKTIKCKVFIDYYKQGLQDYKIASKMNISRIRIQLYREELGLPRNDASKPIQYFYNLGLSDVEISKATRKTRRQVRKWRDQHMLNANNPIDRALDENVDDYEDDTESLFHDVDFISKIIKKNIAIDKLR
jgi:hypothetical protein